jgi:hypothetical protein
MVHEAGKYNTEGLVYGEGCLDPWQKGKERMREIPKEGEFLFTANTAVIMGLIHL